MPDYSQEWEDLAERTTLFFVVWIGGWLAIGVLGAIFGDRAIWLGPLWLLGFFVTAGHRGRFRCPRCGAWFFKPSRMSINPWSRRCYHCGLRIGSNGDNAPRDDRRFQRWRSDMPGVYSYLGRAELAEPGGDP